MRWSILAAATLLLAGCGTDLHVESDTSWSGYIGGDAGASYEGSGNRIYKLDQGVTTCWTFQKETEGGYLRVYANEKGLTGGGKVGSARTTARYGVVTGCTS